VSDTSVINSEAADRYAKAAFELATESKSLKKIEKDLKSLASMMSSNADLGRLINSPVFNPEDQASALMAVCTKAKFSKLTSQFVGTVAKNRRASELPQIISAFEARAARERGTSSAVVTSAQKLTPAQLKSLKLNLKKSIGKDVDIETKVDPDLLGGFVVKIGSRLYDSSLKTKLEGLKLAMKEV